jgi:hypothetical protein
VVAVAQLVEHRIVIPSVAGSSPVSHPKFLPKEFDKRENRQMF